MPTRIKPNDDETFVRRPHYLHELPFEDEERLGKLFSKLDKNGNGKIDIHDLSEALKEHGYAEAERHYAEKFLKSSKSKSGDLSLADFIYYVREHEKNLRLHFSHLDRNKDGKIDLEELIRAFSDLGIPLDQMEATKLLQRMDQDGSLNISYDEWRDFLLLAPSSDIHQLITYWRHSTYCLQSDFGTARSCTADALTLLLPVAKGRILVYDPNLLITTTLNEIDKVKAEHSIKRIGTYFAAPSYN